MRAVRQKRRVESSASRKGALALAANSPADTDDLLREGRFRSEPTAPRGRLGLPGRTSPMALRRYNPNSSSSPTSTVPSRRARSTTGLVKPPLLNSQQCLENSNRYQKRRKLSASS